MMDAEIGAGTRVMLIDDDRVGLESLSRALGKLGCDVSGFESPSAALGYCGRGEFDLVLTDLCMPGMNGIELMREIHDRDPGLRVVVISGSGDDSWRGKAMDSGAYGVIGKPLSLGDLRRILSDINTNGLRTDSNGIHSGGGGRNINSERLTVWMR